MAYQKKDRAERGDRADFTVRRVPQIPATDKIDLNDIELLRNYVTEFGKIKPARVTGVTSMQQRAIKKGVRRARVFSGRPLFLFLQLVVCRGGISRASIRRRRSRPCRPPAVRPEAAGRSARSARP